MVLQPITVPTVPQDHQALSGTSSSDPTPQNPFLWLAILISGGVLPLVAKSLLIDSAKPQNSSTSDSLYRLKIREFDHLTDRVLGQEDLIIPIGRKTIIGVGIDCDYSMHEAEDLQQAFSIVVLPTHEVQIVPLSSAPMHVRVGNRDLSLKKGGEVLPIQVDFLQVICRDRRFLLEFIPSTDDQAARETLVAHLTQHSN